MATSEKILAIVLADFGFNAANVNCTLTGSGLINHTWKIQDGEEAYILQRINDNVFTNVQAITQNIDAIGAYLQQAQPGYFFVRPLQTASGASMVECEEGSFRMFPFVPHSHTIDVVSSPQQAFEAAKQFAKFTRMLKSFDTGTLKETIPDFHNISLRYKQFEQALQQGNAERIEEAQELVRQLIAYKDIVTQFEHIKQDADFKIRVTHHDTKISNVLFDANDKGICVIDLDTVMPGYCISDIGDMLRTYLCPVSEEEQDLSAIEIRPAIYQAICEGYLSEMGTELTQKEKAHFHYAGRYMIYMQALRFLTDHLNNDVYYGSKYPGHNLVRATNQLRLLDKLTAFKPGW